jgi:hypothetical protein
VVTLGYIFSAVLVWRHPEMSEAALLVNLAFSLYWIWEV